jgi:hypothetical protein
MMQAWVPYGVKSFINIQEHSRCRHLIVEIKSYKVRWPQCRAVTCMKLNLT